MALVYKIAFMAKWFSFLLTFMRSSFTIATRLVNRWLACARCVRVGEPHKDRFDFKLFCYASSFHRFS